MGNYKLKHEVYKIFENVISARKQNHTLLKDLFKLIVPSIPDTKATLQEIEVRLQNG